MHLPKFRQFLQMNSEARRMQFSGEFEKALPSIQSDI